MLVRLEDFFKLSKSESFRALQFSIFESFKGLKRLARLEYFRALKFARLESFRALKFISLPDMTHEHRESEYIIYIHKNLFKLFSF